MAVVLVIGVVFALAGATLLLNAGGSADFVMRHVTSKSVGSLAPGFANSREGFAVYARLLSAIGVILLGLAIADRYALFGAGVAIAGVLGFVALSVIAIRGEAETYRGLKR